MDNLIKQLEAFVPYNEQEERDLSVMLDLAKSGADVLTRKNKTAHFSASAWIVSPDRKSTLMCFHNIYNSWSWTCRRRCWFKARRRKGNRRRVRPFPGQAAFSGWRHILRRDFDGQRAWKTRRIRAFPSASERDVSFGNGSCIWPAKQTWRKQGGFLDQDCRSLKARFRTMDEWTNLFKTR